MTVDPGLLDGAAEDHLRRTPLGLVAPPSRTVFGVALVAAAVAGVALGFSTQILQGWLTGSWAVLANSGVMWAVAAFAVGMTMPSLRSAATGGAITLVVASVSYYVAVDWLEGVSSGPRGAVVWSIAGIVAGSSFGSVGYLSRRSRQHRPSAWAFLAGVVAGEGIHLTWFVGNLDLRPAGIAELAIAGTITTMCLCRTRSAGRTSAIAVSTAVATLLAGRIIDGVFAAW